jgi:ABC-type Fe3+ transport system permease subunit
MLPVFDQSFWNSIWASVISSTLFTFVLTVIILWTVNKYRRPKLSVFVEIGNRVTQEKVLHISIANTR